MSIREELILKVLAKEDSVVELAHQYGVSRKTTRRPTPRTIGGFPEGCRMVRVNGHGNIHADGWKAYVNHALSHYTLGLEFREQEVRVWFFDVLLGAFDPRTQQSVEPIAPLSERK